MGELALAPEDVTEDFPIVIGTVEAIYGRSGTVTLAEFGVPCFLAGARRVKL
jgi:hypothetical protein